MRLNKLKKGILLIVMLSLLLGLAACGTEPEPAITPEPEETPAPVQGYKAEVTGAGSFSAGFAGICATERGFYAVTAENAGEYIPESVINEAKKKNRSVTNDGRYDIIREKLWFITETGYARELKDYTPLPAEENRGGWKSFASLSKLCAARKGSGVGLETLECTTVSGNSVPANRRDYDPSKNYYEYETRWYIRELSVTGRELSCRSVSPEDALQFRKSCEGAAWPAGCSAQTIGISESAICSPIWSDDASFRFLVSEEEESGNIMVSVVSVSEVQWESDEAPVVLKLAVESSGMRLKNAVAAFNAENNGAVIELIEGDDAEADLFVVTPDSCRRLAKLGALEDLYPYLDKDPLLSRHQFLPNVLKSAEISGGLYSTCAGFTVDTAMGLSSLTGDSAGWTYGEFLTAWNDQGMGTDAFDVTTTRSDVLRACLHASLGRLVNDDGSCNFRAEEFRQLLSFARNFRASYSNNGNWSSGDAADLRVRNGRQLLLMRTICNMSDAALCGYEFAEEFSFKGYPTLEGSGNLLTISTLEVGQNLAMSNTCENKAAAWQFLREFFTKDYQKDYLYFPTNRSLFEQQLSDQMKHDYVRDKKGEIVTNDKTGEPLIISTGEIYLSNWVTVYLYPISETKADKLREMVTGATALANDYETLIDVIEAAAEPFFLEAATLEETVERVQSIVNEYLK